jgi:hypothetical protein
MYKYWKYGSFDYNEHKHSETHLINMQKYNIKDFIIFVKNKDLILITPFTSHTHIRPQSWWINEEDYKKCIIIYYDKNEMEKKIFELFDYLEQLKICKNLKIPFQKINVSNVNNNEKIILDEEDKKEIYEIYKSDFDLINFASSTGSKYENNIEPLLDVYKSFFSYFGCKDLVINSLEFQDVADIFDQNMDGLLINYSIFIPENYEL